MKLIVVEQNRSSMRIISLPLINFSRYYHVKLGHHTTPPEVELKFQMQVMRKMMERMNFVMGNVCDRLDRVEKCGNEANISIYDARKVCVEPKSNNVKRVEKTR